jgi:hypothetical protein
MAASSAATGSRVRIAVQVRMTIGRYRVVRRFRFHPYPSPHLHRGLDVADDRLAAFEALAINPQAAQRIRAYLEKARHGDQHDAPLFRPLRGNAKPLDAAGRMDPDAIDRLTRKYAAEIGLGRGYSAHSMRATFITTALENGAQLEDVQKAAGHRDPSTTKLYDRRGYNPEKAASFFAIY